MARKIKLIWYKIDGQPTQVVYSKKNQMITSKKALEIKKQLIGKVGKTKLKRFERVYM